MVKIKNIKLGSAVVVKAIGVSELKDGDVCLVGVKCIYRDGTYHPIPKRWQLIPDVMDDPQGDELVIIKRDK